jgi:hypothetical protein
MMKVLFLLIGAWSLFGFSKLTEAQSIIPIDASNVLNYRRMVKRDDLYEYAPSVMQENGVYKMWVCGNRRLYDDNDHIYYSTSTDGNTWSSYVEKFSAKENSPDQAYWACDPSVLHLENYYYMYYSSILPNTLGGGGTQIYTAISTDGNTWTYVNDGKAAIPITKLVNGYGAGQSSVIYNNGKFLHFFLDTSREQKHQVYLKTSDDFGATFKVPLYNDQPVITNATSVDFKYYEPLKKYIGIGEYPIQWQLAMFVLDENLSLEKVMPLPTTLSDGNITNPCNHNPGLLGDRTGKLITSGMTVTAYTSAGPMGKKSDGTPVCLGDFPTSGGVRGSNNWDIWTFKIDMTPYLVPPPTITPTPTFVPPTLTPTPTPTVVIINPTITPTPTVASKCSLCASLPNGKANGDANCSGTTTISDAEIWREEYVASEGEKLVKNNWRADFNCDGVVGLDDAEVWREKYIELNRGG